MAVNTGNPELDRKVEDWLKWDKNEKNKAEIKELLKVNDVDTLVKIFEKRLEFGTAGLRGVMAAGPSRMNDLTVIQATQGMAKYLLECFDDVKTQGVVIGYDGRYNSSRFASLATRAFITMGIPVHLFSALVPTPYIPFSVCRLKTKAGIMITASHNPKEDNGYKVYWENGAQIISPDDKNILLRSLDNLAPWDEAWDDSVREHALVSDPLENINQLYFDVLSKECLRDELNQKTSLKFTYTPVHGVGAPYVKMAFETCKFQPYIPVQEQIEPDPEFSTVKFPNPEEGKSTLNLALATAARNNSTVILANDPDADRLAVAELQPNGEWKVFSGNELGALLGWWMWTRAEQKGQDPTTAAMIASTVSSKILQTMAEREGFLFDETLTGFKWMANRGLQLQKEGYQILFAFEEAIGFMCGIHVPDKDGVSAAAHLSEMAVHLESKGSTLNGQLQEIYLKYGHHVSLVSYYLCYDPVVINRIFERLRNFENAPKTYPKSLMGGKYVVKGVRDLTNGFDSRQPDGKALLPTSSSSQMITFYFENGLDATIRTSGTEPKIKYYTELRAPPTQSDRQQVQATLDEMVQALVDEFLQPTLNHLTPRPE
ncbi:phosphoglucomutase-2-like [Daphnia pulex]|uniref:phosphoglucomutase-2-like n=1 Tax=Daphnia pulex TaxID=6669 RepID=UPI001EE007F2|nr:phosphoglucomutase-2-like [Daphnia pulex]XP_046442178.1 phosphoglucomutase-2-like [Daphnia pulex]XP_046442179.1 phosphoglucomutase-2-like [Daphnia pulex]